MLVEILQWTMRGTHALSAGVVVEMPDDEANALIEQGIAREDSTAAVSSDVAPDDSAQRRRSRGTRGGHGDPHP